MAPQVTFWRLVLVLVLGSSRLITAVVTNPRIVEDPEDQYVAKNEPATLNCKAEGNPKPIITWYRNGRQVITANDNPSSHRMLLPSGQLFFLRIIHNKSQKPDVGVYYCNATNPETKQWVRSKNASLEIAVLKDDFKVHPRSQKVGVGESVVLECRPPKGLPEPRVSWTKDGEMVDENSRIHMTPNGNLVINHAQKTDTGVYTCLASNVAGEKSSNPANVVIMEKPKIANPPQDILVYENQDVEFKCSATGDPEPTIIWSREKGMIPSGRSQVTEDKGLRISGVKVADEGTYICRAENEVGTVEAVARLTIHSQPSFLVTPKDKVVGLGRAVSLRCQVKGNPPPAVFWNKETSEILMFPRQDHGRFSVSDDGTLKIEPVRKDDEGEYVCQALSVAGSAFAKARIEVKDVDPRPPPIIHQGPQNQTLPINSVAMLPCQASGDPSPTIRWFRNNRPLLTNDPRVTLLNSGTLQISDLRKSDSGLYTCRANSETGETTWSASLVVEAPSNTAVKFHRTPEPSTFPGPPSKPEINEIKETSLRLHWVPNRNQGASRVKQYTVEYFSHETGEGWVVANNQITATSYVVRNLRKDTSYMFLVRAQNNQGWSLPSPVAGPIRTKGGDGVQPTLPQFDLHLVEAQLNGEVVRMLPAETISSTQIKVNWRVLRAQRYIEGFHIKYRQMPGHDRYSHGYGHKHVHVPYTTETVPSSAVTTYFLKHLAKYTQYEIRVQPFYSSVEGQMSNTVRIRTFEDVPSAPPMSIHANLEANKSIFLRWTPPPVDKHNGALIGYKIFCLGNTSKFHRNITVNASTTHFLIRHIVPGMKYTIQLAAYNRMGIGVRSSPYIVGKGKMSGYKRGIHTERWFIFTMVGVIGGIIWFALFVFSVWLYRKRRARKKSVKNGVVTVPVHKPTDPTRAGNDLTDLQKDANRPADHMQPDLTNILDRKEDVKENMYNVPHTPQMKTFYNKANAMNSCTPYATTLIANNIINKQVPDSAFRPISKGYIRQPSDRSGSGDSCQKPDLSSDSNTDNSRPNTEMLPHEQCDRMMSPMSNTSMTQSYHQQGALPYCDDPGTGMSKGRAAKLQQLQMQHAQLQHQYHQKQAMPNWADLLPPPPEHPPPSDIGTPPDSPTNTLRCESPASSRYSDHSCHHGNGQHINSARSPMSPMMQGSVSSLRTPVNDNKLPAPPRNLPLSDSEQRSHPAASKRAFSPQTLNEHRTRSPRTNPNMGMDHQRNNSPQARSQSPGSCSFQHGERGKMFNPRSVVSDTERGPTPPVRGYRLIPLRDPDQGPPMCEGERGPTPPVRGTMNISPTDPEMEPLMDRACQSSLPSLINENMQSPNARLEMSTHGPVLSVHPGNDLHGPSNDLHGRDSPNSECYHENEYVGESDMEPDHEHGQRRDCHSPGSSVCDIDSCVTSGMLATWASVTDNSNSSCSSDDRTSAASSSDGSFFTEADFASAVAKAAELSGLTVVGSTVCDPNGVMEKAMKKHRHRERRANRPTSPYSTDSNFSHVPHKPYPKSQRKKQLQEQAMRYANGVAKPDMASPNKAKPPVKNKPAVPANVADLPSYNKPNFPSPSGPAPSNIGMGTQGRGTNRSRGNMGGPRTPTAEQPLMEGGNVRVNPMTYAYHDYPPVV